MSNITFLLQSDDCNSENSSIFNRMRRRDGLKLKTKKKSSSSPSTDEVPLIGGPQPIASPAVVLTTGNSNLSSEVNKPLIAKLKAGVKLQVTERVSENQGNY